MADTNSAQLNRPWHNREKPDAARLQSAVQQLCISREQVAELQGYIKRLLDEERDAQQFPIELLLIGRFQREWEAWLKAPLDQTHSALRDCVAALRQGIPLLQHSTARRRCVGHLRGLSHEVFEIHDIPRRNPTLLIVENGPLGISPVIDSSASGNEPDSPILGDKLVVAPLKTTHPAWQDLADDISRPQGPLPGTQDTEPSKTPVSGSGPSRQRVRAEPSLREPNASHRHQQRLPNLRPPLADACPPRPTLRATTKRRSAPPSSSAPLTEPPRPPPRYRPDTHPSLNPPLANTTTTTAMHTLNNVMANSSSHKSTYSQPPKASASAPHPHHRRHAPTSSLPSSTLLLHPGSAEAEEAGARARGPAAGWGPASV
ncbi:706bad9c-83b3-4245-a438-962043aa3c80 [Thermothielavioides terrestris]|uniref:706bad9c-83b3-4245-a438-962043aa3c80 n=1 Tax=Thermothielavioides terrestris TaxID=2587410 RepID=A0A446BN15_9PEZI|nr:706bad9c-83b3-4245-a438-962043aa3c80 [Thermothielavioides terrestris]